MKDIPRSRDPEARSGHSQPSEHVDQAFDTILFKDAWRWVYQHSSPTRSPVRMVIEPELADPGDPYYQFRLEHLSIDQQTQTDGVPTYRSQSRGARCRALEAEINAIDDPISETDVHPDVGMISVEYNLTQTSGSLPQELCALLGGQPHTGIIDVDVDLDESTAKLTIDADRGTAFYRDWWDVGPQD